MAGRSLRRTRQNPNEYTKAQYPYEVFYQRKVKGRILSGSVPIATREEAKACVQGMKRSPDVIEAFVRKRNPAVVKAKAKKVVDKTSQAYEQRQAARGFGGYAKMDPCPACGKRRAVEPCIGTDEGGKCPESSKWVGDAICMQCINVERRKAGLQAVDVYGEPLIRKAKRNPEQYFAAVVPHGRAKTVVGDFGVGEGRGSLGYRVITGTEILSKTTGGFFPWDDRRHGKEGLKFFGFVALTRAGKDFAHRRESFDSEADRDAFVAETVEHYRQRAVRRAKAWKAKYEAGKVARDPFAEFREKNPRHLVHNPYLSKFIPPGGKGYQYVYSEEDVAKRHAKKAQRIEALKRKEASLRAAVKRDVAAGDDAALAVGLILATYERPGNPGSAKAGHYGVTGWECRHLSTDKRKATIDYIAKSGVHQTKVIKDAYLVEALAAKAKKCGRRKSGRLLPVSASAVNRYLDTFDVSAKDLRTFGANTEMQRELKRARAAGPDLSTLKPRDVKKTLKAEFTAALGIVAGRLGHTTSVLRKQYLVSTVEPTYLETGAVVQTFT